MRHHKADDREIILLKSKVAALEQLLEVYEQTTIEQFEELEKALNSLTKRARELETVARVSFGVSTVLNTSELLQAVVDMTKSNFDLYHTHIYLLNEAGDTLELTAAAGKVGRKMVAEGWQISLDQEKSLVARAARTQTGVMINDVRQSPDWLPNPNLPDTLSELAVPMIVGDRVLGVLDVQADVVNRFTREDAHIQTTLASQVAVSLENARLFQQTERALSEMEILYQIGTQLNAVTGLDEILQVITLPDVAPNLGSAALLLFHSDKQGGPEVAELVATSVYDEALNNVLSYPIGASFALVDFPLSKLWLSDPNEPLLISNIAEDKRLDETLCQICQEANIQAMAVIPLTLGGHWLGVASMLWIEPYTFTERDQRLYRSIAGQAAIVVNNWFLLRQTQTRAAQLEKLSTIETALSQATTEEEIVTAIALIMGDEPVDLVTLGYINEDGRGQPITLTSVSSWRNGTVWAEDPIQGQVLSLERYPFAQFFIESSDQVVFMDDLQTDERIDGVTQELAFQLGIRAMVGMPLRSGGQWQGLVTFSWRDPQRFGANEKFIFRQLLEPIAAVVASRRAYLKQQTTLTEMEALYHTARRINEAGDLQQVIALVVEELAIPVVNRAVLFTFEYNPAGEIDAMTVIGNWYSGEGTPPVSIGTYYPFKKFTAINYLLTPDPLFVPDIEQAEQINPKTLEILKELDISAMVILPLWGGNRQLGALVFEAEEVYHFNERDVYLYTSLAQQVAITVDNQRLLREAQMALGEVEATQRRYTLQAWEAYQAKSPVHSYQRVRQGEISTDNDLPAEVSQVIKDKRLVVTNYKLDSVDNNSFENGQASVRSTEAKIIAPLTVRDEVIGVLGVQEDNSSREWSPEEVAFVEAIAREIAQAAENLRLLDETQQRAAREKRVNDIGEKIQAAQTLEEALQIAIKEVGLSLNVPHTTVELKVV